MDLLRHHQCQRLERVVEIRTDADLLLIGACLFHWGHLKEQRIGLIPTTLGHMLIVAIHLIAVAARKDDCYRKDQDGQEMLIPHGYRLCLLSSGC